MKIRSLNIYGNYWKFFAVAVGPPLLVAILTIPTLESNEDDDAPDTYCSYKDDNLSLFVENAYYWGRICSILFNFIIFVYISHRVRLMMRVMEVNDNAAAPVIIQNPISPNPSITNTGSRQLDTSNGINQTTAIIALVSRMKYYPLAQVCYPHTPYIIHHIPYTIHSIHCTSLGADAVWFVVERV
ncbi:hypothetical protein EON63_19175 [archaeon]|nr:MAG: hypothetical protein EON63_19175 [archaeon]